MKIILVCSAGMSTSMLAMRMKKEARMRNMKAHIEAIPELELKCHSNTADIVLIGPQIRYLKGEIQKTMETAGAKVAIIDPFAYGLMKGEEVLNQAVALYDTETIDGLL